MSGATANEDARRYMRDFVRTRGAELRRLYGAHAIGLGRKSVGGVRTKRPAILFYVTNKGARPTGAASIPPSIVVHADPRIEVETDVVDGAPAELE